MYRFEHGAKARFIKVLREQFNSGVKYQGRVLKWDTVIGEKTNELARYLSTRTSNLDFVEPSPILESTDDRVVRESILRLTQTEASSRGIGKSTLHYLRKRAKGKESFKIYSKIKRKLVKESCAR